MRGCVEVASCDSGAFESEKSALDVLLAGSETTLKEFVRKHKLYGVEAVVLYSSAFTSQFAEEAVRLANVNPEQRVLDVPDQLRDSFLGISALSLIPAENRSQEHKRPSPKPP